jgi:UPF0176 protein
MVVVAALYHFAQLPDCAALQTKLKTLCDANGIKGILLLAEEGINGTVAGTREAIDLLLATIRSDERLAALAHKESFAETMPFYRMKVRIKKEIVTLNRPEANPAITVGTYVDPKDWNALISDPDVVLLDTRNDYEVNIGTFKNAVNPNTETFVEFPEFVESNFDPKKHKKVAMFCTGGIRCEKASAYMLQAGYENVYHLKGGILKYLEQVPQDESMWEGNCFVFDHRVSVGHGLALTDDSTCYGCRRPLTAADRESEHYKEGEHCHHCFDQLTEKSKKRNAERQKQVMLAKQRNMAHIGVTRNRHLREAHHEAQVS